MRGLWVAGLLLGLWASPFVDTVAAQADGEPGDEARAVQLFEESERLYGLGRYEESLALLRQAHALRPSPTLIYNMARANEQLDRLPQAIAAYEDYLLAAPHAPDRAKVELRIRTLERELQEREALQQRRTEPSPPTFTPPVKQPPAERPPPVEQGPVAWGHAREPTQQEPAAQGPGLAPWVLLGAGGAATVGGLVMYGLARSKRDEANDEAVQRAAQQTFADAEDRMTYGHILVAVGAVAGVAGLTVWLISRDDAEDDDARALLIGPGYVGISGRY